MLTCTDRMHADEAEECMTMASTSRRERRTQAKRKRERGGGREAGLLQQQREEQQTPARRVCERIIAPCVRPINRDYPSKGKPVPLPRALAYKLSTHPKMPHIVPHTA